jgi:hypothetical protein
MGLLIRRRPLLRVTAIAGGPYYDSMLRIEAVAPADAMRAPAHPAGGRRGPWDKRPAF